ncbi:hypothetical protein SRHO_G00325650 [Serrasalmus rhombeus]
MAPSPGPLRERALGKSKEPRQLWRSAALERVSAEGSARFQATGKRRSRDCIRPSRQNEPVRIWRDLA